MNDKIYNLIENEDGTLTAVINEGVIRLEEYPFMPKLFECNENVTQVHIPNSLESCYIDFGDYFPNFKRVSANEENPNWGKFKFVDGGIFASDDQPREDLPYLIPNGDGTLTLDIPEGVRDMSDIGHWDFYDKVTVIKFPASMEDIGDHLTWIFRNLTEIHVHPDNPRFTCEDGVWFSKDKKRIVLCLDKEGRNTYTIPEYVEEIDADCFAEARDIIRINIGKNVRKIGHRGLQSDMSFALKKIYIPATVTELEGEIFDAGADSGGMYYPISVVGGERGSVIDEYCNKRGITFVEVHEDEIVEFYAASVKELRERAREQMENETEFFVDESDRGYQIKYYDGTLEVFVPDGVTMTEINVRDTRVKINKHRREKVRKLIIGDRITEISSLAFDDYKNLEMVYIGKDVQRIDPWAFSGKDGSGSYGCPNLTSIEVDENNKWYKAENGVLYTYDMETLVKYCPAKPELYYEIEPRVRHIGEGAFHYAEHLQCLKIGNGVLSVGELAFFNVGELRHVYIAESVTEWPEDFPFICQWGYDRACRVRGLIIGGPRDSFIQKYCADDGARFLVIEEDRINDFLATPLPVIESYDDESDPYIAECNKLMIISKDGALIQAGEFGEEFVLPEGVVYMHCRVDVSKCKRVVIPSTYNHPWGSGLGTYGSAPLLEEFVVSEDNPQYISIGGHFYDRNGTLMTYAPAAKDQGVLPDGTTKIAEGAFSLIPEPFEKLYIPATLKAFEPRQWGRFFYEADVSPDNHTYKAIDGSIFTADEKTLVYVKISNDGYKVPDGTETIAKDSLSDVSGTVCIPASVTKIENEYGLGHKIIAIRAPKGSYAEQYAKEYDIRAELTVDGVVIEEWDTPKPQYSFTSTDDTPW